MSEAVPTPERTYPQELARTQTVAGTVALTLSAISPVFALYVTLPVLLHHQGSGAFLSLVLAALVGVGFAPCLAELGAAMPVTGGYYTVSHALGRPAGFLCVVIGLVAWMTGPSIIALAAGEYVTALLPFVPARGASIALLLAAAGCAVLSLRLNAFVTGLFLAIEFLAVVVIAVLGFANLQRPFSTLLAPQVFASDHAAVPASFAVVLAGVAAANSAYNGYDTAIHFSEELKGSRRGVAHAVLWSFAIVVLVVLLPVTAALLGAPSLEALASSPAPVSYLLRSLGGETLGTVVTAGVVVALFNALIVAFLVGGRFLFATVRDGMWPEVIGRRLGALHPRWKSPWIATLALGLVGMVTTSLTSVDVLVVYSGTLGLGYYALVIVAALASRRTQRDLPRPWRMPLWPLPALLGLGGLALSAVEQSWTDLAITATAYTVGLAYYRFYLYPRRATRWLAVSPSPEVTDP